MAESVTIARPYAEALFPGGQGKRQSGQVVAGQVSLLAQVAANPEARAAIGDPNVAAPQLVDLFRSACGTAVDAELANFIQLLSNNDRLGLLPEIAVPCSKATSRPKRVPSRPRSFRPSRSTTSQVNALLPQLEAVFKSKLEASVSVDSGH